MFDLATVNILCIGFIALELAQAFTERVNTWKMYGFVGSSAISGIVAPLNILNDIKEEVFSLSKLSFWGWLWLGLLSTSIIALAVILIRMFHWNQDQWEEVRKWKQEYRKDRMQVSRKLRDSKQSYKSELLEEKFYAKINKQKAQTDKDTVVRNKKYDQLLERLNDWKKYGGDITAIILNRVKLLGSFVVSILIAVLFLIIPYSTKFQDIVISWLDAIKKLADLIKIIPMDDNQDEFFPAFANYIICSFVSRFTKVSLLSVARAILWQNTIFEYLSTLTKLFLYSQFSLLIQFKNHLKKINGFCTHFTITSALSYSSPALSVTIRSENRIPEITSTYPSCSSPGCIWASLTK